MRDGVIFVDFSNDDIESFMSSDWRWNLDAILQSAQTHREDVEALINDMSDEQYISYIGQNAFNGCNSITSAKFLNRETNIATTYSLSANIKIIGYSNSTAEDYAIKYNRIFEVISE